MWVKLHSFFLCTLSYYLGVFKMWITGAELFVKALKEEKVDTLFAYPGGQAIDLFDALYSQNDINIILPNFLKNFFIASVILELIVIILSLFYFK